MELELLKELRLLADEILKETLRLTFSEDPKRMEQDVNAYADLMDKREPLVIKMTQLKKQINMDIINNNGVYIKEWEETERIIKEIIALDKEQKTIIQQNMLSVKSSIKEINDSIKLTNLYMQFPDDLQVGLLDTKK